jgi:ornithine cyclodeaminase
MRLPSLRRLYLYDSIAERAEQFGRACALRFPGVRVERMRELKAVLRAAPLISVATTATRPHITDLSGVAPSATILHVSLRDLAPEVILACDNIVDDVDHVCRAQTSVHLAEQRSGTRDFIRCVLVEITSGHAPARTGNRAIAVFSPFGLGVLDVAVGEFVHRRAIQGGNGIWIDSFFPEARLSARSPAGRPAVARSASL